MEIPVIIGQQAGKKTLTGTLPVNIIVDELRTGHVTVNNEAQRSLAKGANQDTTKELLESDKVHTQKRMKSFIGFLERVMDNIEEGVNTEGFLGAVQLVVPENFRDAKVRLLKVPEDLREGSASLSYFLDALAEANAGVFSMKPDLGEAGLHLTDGQGRCFAFHSLERAAQVRLKKAQDAVRAAEKKYEPTDELEGQVAKLKKELVRVRRFLSNTSLSFVIYVADVTPEGEVVGLPVEAERRLYIEGNALNSMASKEEVIKYEYFSPVVVDLQGFRGQEDWMGPDLIEEDTKSISKNSTKLFTLSALVQAYSFSVINDNKPLKDIDEDMFEQTGAHADFVHAYWQRIGEIFGRLWLRDIDDPSARFKFIQQERNEHQNVAFQAIFLQALGRLGYALGKASDWDADSANLEQLELLRPDRIDYRARHTLPENGEVNPAHFNRDWTSTMMKEATDQDGNFKGYNFNNVSDSITKTYRHLARIINLDTIEAAEDEPAEAELVF